MANLTKLRAELKKKQVAKKKALQEAIECIKIEQEIKKLDNPLFEKLEISSSNNARLDALLDYLENDLRIVVRAVYGYGSIVGKILTLARSVMYSKIEQKTDALLFLNVDESIIEDLLDALGNTQYYSKEARGIIPAVNCDISATKDLMRLLAVQLELANADLSKFNDKTVSYQYSNAELRAKQTLNNSIADQDQDDVEYDEDVA